MFGKNLHIIYSCNYLSTHLITLFLVLFIYSIFGFLPLLALSLQPRRCIRRSRRPSGEAALGLKAAINIVCTVLLTKLRCVTLMDDYNRYLHSDDVVFHLLLRLSYVIQAPRGAQGGERGLVRRCAPSLSPRPFVIVSARESR